MININNTARIVLGGLALLAISTGCASQAAEVLNPFAVEPAVTLGERSNKAILEGGGQNSEAEKARHALEVMGSYQRAHAPQPTHPVIRPAVVRLMWVPDHLNRSGDLVPAHYYYLRVLNDRWAVSDAFELERQLNEGSVGSGTATPWVYGRSRR